MLRNRFLDSRSQGAVNRATDVRRYLVPGNAPAARGSDSHGRQSRALHRRSLTQRASSSGASPHLTAELAAIQVPVLVLAGDEDEGYGASTPSTAVSQVHRVVVLQVRRVPGLP